jgi:hypothetical protein
MPRLQSTRFYECAQEIFALFEPLFELSPEPPAIAAAYVFESLGMPGRYSNKLFYEVKRYLGIKSELANDNNTKNLLSNYTRIHPDKHVSLRYLRLKIRLMRNDEEKHFYVWRLRRSIVLNKSHGSGITYETAEKKKHRLFSESELRKRLKEIEEAQKVKVHGPYKKSELPREALETAMRKLHYDAPADLVMQLAKTVMVSHRPIGKLSLLYAKKNLGIESIKRGKKEVQRWYWVWGAPEIVQWLLNSVAASPVSVDQLLEESIWSADAVNAARRKTDIEITFVNGKQCWYRNAQEETEIEEDEKSAPDVYEHVTNPMVMRRKQMQKDAERAAQMAAETRRVKQKKREEVERRSKRSISLEGARTSSATSKKKSSEPEWLDL